MAHARCRHSCFQCDVLSLTKRIKKLRKQKSSPDGVTAENFRQLSPTLLAQLAQAITDMFTALDFETQWTTVAVSLIPKKPSPIKLSEFSSISSWSTRERHTVQLVPNGLSSQNRRLVRSVFLGESKRAREGVEDSSVPGTAGPQEGL